MAWMCSLVTRFYISLFILFLYCCAGNVTDLILQSLLCYMKLTLCNCKGNSRQFLIGVPLQTNCSIN